MTQNDVLLLLTHGALSGMCSRPPIAALADIGLQSVQAASHALEALKGAGFSFDDSDAPADPPRTSVVSGAYDSSGATDGPAALGIAKSILDSDKSLRDVSLQTIRDFQYAAGLKVDGNAGPKTLAAYLYWSSQVTG